MATQSTVWIALQFRNPPLLWRHSPFLLPVIACFERWALYPAERIVPVVPHFHVGDGPTPGKNWELNHEIKLWFYIITGSTLGIGQHFLDMVLVNWNDSDRHCTCCRKCLSYKQQLSSKQACPTEAEDPRYLDALKSILEPPAMSWLRFVHK